MIACIGDVHRSFHRLAEIISGIPREIQTVIQVGDLGLRPDDLASGTVPCWPDRTVYYITGNHDHDPWYRGQQLPTEMVPNLVHVPRGTIMEMDGRRIAFLGGGDSVIDRVSRREGVDWWPDERVTAADIAAFEGAAKVDLLVAHTPPAFVYPSFDFLPDPSAILVEEAWRRLGEPAVVCGHLHKARSVGPVRVLAELEVLFL